MQEADRTISSYNAHASAYARRWFDFRLDDNVNRFAARLQPGARILDVGCGVGRDVGHLRELGFKAAGIDLSRGMLIEARRRVKAPFVRADMRRLPFGDGSFDALWVCASLLHLPQAQAPAALAECGRVLGRGHIFLTLKRGRGERWVQKPDSDQTYFFAYYFPAEIKVLLKQAGFCLLESWENPPGPGQSHPWLNIIASV